MQIGSSKNQKDLMQTSEIKPITYSELADNEYFDVHNGQKQNPYEPKVKDMKVEKNDQKSDDGKELISKLSPEDLEDTFFCLVNLSRETIEAGEQIFISYGQFSNRHLLNSYGFCIPNKHDNYELWMRLDLPEETHTLSELIDFEFKSFSTEKILLKKDLLSGELLAYLRALCKQSIYKSDEQKVKQPNAMQGVFLHPDVLLSKPTDLVFEQYVFEQYFGILIILDTRMNSVTTFEEDLKLLESGDLNWQMQMSVTYRSLKKQLIKSQLNIVKKTLDVIRKINTTIDP